MLTTKFYHSDGSLWLTSELANELAKHGHNVVILNLEWSGRVVNLDKKEFKLLNYVACHIKIPWFSVAFRWAFSSLKTFPVLIKSILRREKYDLLIAFSPCSALYSAIPLAQIFCQKSFLIYWDFFPVHNQEISRKAPGFLIPTLKALERKLVHSFDQVGCMSQANMNFYEKYFGLSPIQNLRILPIWTSYTNYGSSNKKSIRDNLKIDNAAIVLVFGGQLFQGRGIIELCHAVIKANKIDGRIMLLICGTGSQVNTIGNIEKENPTIVKSLGFVKREKYLDILCASDIGVVSTVSGVSSPSYPSKSLDYMACGLPILAALETASDFGEIAETNHFGISCPANDISAMTKAIMRLSFNEEWRQELGKNGKRYLKSTHDISKIVNIITGENA